MEIKETKRGGARTGAGRKPGVRDKATGEQRASLEELARTHTEAALAVLAKVMNEGESESARVSAANSMLDRGYGRPRQAVDMSGDLNHKIENADAKFGAVAGALEGLARTKQGSTSQSGDVDTASPPTATDTKR